MRMTHEKNIPTQQTATQKDDRISCSNEDHGRSKSDPKTSPCGTQRTFRLRARKEITAQSETAQQFPKMDRCSFPKTARLRKRREFARLQKVGKRFVGRLLCVDIAQGSRELPRLGISVSSKYGNSPERNRFKRIVREAFRISYPSIPPFLELHIVPRQLAKESSSKEIQHELLWLVSGAHTRFKNCPGIK